MSMDCKQREEQIIDFLYGELNENIAIEIKNHLKNCPECTKLFSQFNEVRTLAQKNEFINPPTSFDENILKLAHNSCIKKSSRGYVSLLSRVINFFQTPRYAAASIAAAGLLLMTIITLNPTHEKILKHETSEGQGPFIGSQKKSSSESESNFVSPSERLNALKKEVPKQEENQLSTAVLREKEQKEINSNLKTPFASTRDTQKPKTSSLDSLLSLSLDQSQIHDESKAPKRSSSAPFSTKPQSQLHDDPFTLKESPEENRTTAEQSQTTSYTTDVTEVAKRESETQNFFDKGIKLYQEKNYTAAIPVFKAHLQLNLQEPVKNARALHILALSYQKTGNLKEAALNYDLLLSKYPSYSQINKAKTEAYQCYKSLGQEEKAREISDSIIHDPTH